ncbi:MAG: PhnD/SsuA/transferrin family substrate-binding protein [Pseudomonadota bacterium]
MERRAFLALGLLLLSPSAPAAVRTRPLRIGLTPTLLHERHALLARWKAYLEPRLEVPVTFVLRDSYSDTMDLIKQGRLDVAWLSDYPYVLMKPKVRLLVTPLMEGRPYYRSYLIVPAGDRQSRSLADLEGKVFAYADPYSHTGYLYPRHELVTMGKRPKNFFGRTFFTWSHRKAIEAVAQHLADGAAVESYVWDALARVEPGITGATRIVNRSREFGFPPLVTLKALPERTFRNLRRVLMEMEHHPEGREILSGLHIDGFIPADPELYAEVEAMARMAGGQDDGAGF